MSSDVLLMSHFIIAMVKVVASFEQISCLKKKIHPEFTMICKIKMIDFLIVSITNRRNLTEGIRLIFC